ncbi:S26 family signal peptidase [Natronomonas sp.]|uniref:S26 family signal peptidase n=1 Tax=Natronomonas sp. TaxID=2184060 RepID=UPI002622E140|nr:S26 family signal peptidase [Natronomonas sp.]
MTDRTGEDRAEDPADASSGADADRAGGTSGGPDEPIGPSGGPDRAGSEGDRPEGVLGWIRWFRAVDSGPLLYVRDLVTSVLIVLAIGGVLFAASGVWPPMVAVISDSMEPNMERGDLVIVVDNERFTPEAGVTHEGEQTGVVPADVARTTGRTTFNAPGDVIVFQPNGNAGRTPVIHRTMLWVEEGENWYDRADPDAVGSADSCAELHHCPADHAGFITKGDNERTNANYDQVTRLSAPIRPAWIIGTAELRVPYLGHVRLLFSSVGADPAGSAPEARAGPDPTPAAIDRAKRGDAAAMRDGRAA